MSWNEWKLKINASLRHDDIFCARSIVTLILRKILYQHHGYPLFMPHHCFLVSKLPSLYTHTLLPFLRFPSFSPTYNKSFIKTIFLHFHLHLEGIISFRTVGDYSCVLSWFSSSSQLLKSRNFSFVPRSPQRRNLDNSKDKF